VLRVPELDAGLTVGSHQSGVEGQKPLPGPAGHTAFDAAQDIDSYGACAKFMKLTTTLKTKG